DRCLIADPKVTQLQIGRQRWSDAAAVEVVAPSGDGDPLVVVEAGAPATPRRSGRDTRATVVTTPAGPARRQPAAPARSNPAAKPDGKPDGKSAGKTAAARLK